MRHIKNSYFRALFLVTSGGKLPEYSDLWRCYHPTALMLDSDYCLFADSGRFSTTRYEAEKTGQGTQKRLYVPVTRKVSITDDTKAPNSPCKVTDTDDSKAANSSCKVSRTIEKKEHGLQKLVSPKTGKEYLVTVLD